MTGHLIYVGSASAPPQLVFAGHLQTGSDVIINTSGNVSSARIVRVSWSRDSAAGVYAPITERGTIVVDDVIVSCYAEFSSHVIAHACLAPLRYVYYLCELISQWLFQQSAADADVDGVHWYAALLRRLAKPVLPKEFWWSAA